MIFKNLLVPVLLLSNLIAAVHADIYKCTSNEGKTIYQQLPCEQKLQQEIIEKTERDIEEGEANKPSSDSVITKDQL